MSPRAPRSANTTASQPLALNPFDLFAVLGGFFEPFSAAEPKARYGTRGEYVQRVKRSARALGESRFIPLRRTT